MGAGDAFDTANVQWDRFSAKLKSLKKPLLEAGMLTKKELSARLGVSRTTIGKLRTQGRIKARICNDAGEWLYWPPKDRSSLFSGGSRIAAVGMEITRNYPTQQVRPRVFPKLGGQIA